MTETAAVSANAKGMSFCPLATGLTRNFIGRHGWNGSIKQKETHWNSSIGEGHGASHGKHCPVSVSPCRIFAILLFSSVLYVFVIGRTRTWKEKKANLTRYFKNLLADPLQVPLSCSFNVTTTLMFIFSALQGRGEG